MFERPGPRQHFDDRVGDSCLDEGAGRDQRLAAIDFLNLDATEVIKNGTGPSGAHSDICHPAVAQTVWQAAAIGAEAR